MGLPSRLENKKSKSSLVYLKNKFCGYEHRILIFLNKPDKDVIGLVVIHLFNKHLLRAYYVTETVGSTGENEMAKTETRPRA